MSSPPKSSPKSPPKSPATDPATEQPSTVANETIEVVRFSESPPPKVHEPSMQALTKCVDGV